MSAVLEFKQFELIKSEVIYGVSWEVYESLLEKYREMPVPRLTFDSGILEVEMPNSLEHEEDGRNLAALFEQIAIELEIDFRRSGSTTFKNQNIRKGFEPDASFYVQSLENENDRKIDSQIAPDLIIEINRTSSSVPRMPVFAAFGVREIWRLADESLKFYTLENGVYLETLTSIALPVLSSAKAYQFLQTSYQMKSTAWAKSIRAWAQTEKNQ